MSRLWWTGEGCTGVDRTVQDQTRLDKTGKDHITWMHCNYNRIVDTNCATYQYRYCCRYHRNVFHHQYIDHFECMLKVKAKKMKLLEPLQG